jgi:hypothetical protein
MSNFNGNLIIAEPKRMTEQEARMVGAYAMDLSKLRQLRNAASGSGQITTRDGQVYLTGEDLQAVLSLLIERNSVFLTSFNIQLDEVPQ